MALAEQVSGEDLEALFDTWLFTPEKPPGSAVLTGAGNVAVS
jgi:CubicO group peptidase (beta-lactamase class C family)